MATVATDDVWTTGDFTSDQPIASRMNKENYFLAEEEDSADMLRWVYSINVCPCGGCSGTSWRKHHAWSFIGKHECLEYLKYHLMESGHHKWSEAVTDQYIQDNMHKLVWHEYNDIWTMRETYRNHQKQIKEERAQHNHNANKGNGKGKGKGNKAGDTAGAVAEMVPAIINALAPALRQSIVMHSRDREDVIPGLHIIEGPPPVPDGPLTVDTQELLTLRENVRRAEQAAQSCMCTVVECAKRMRTEVAVVAKARHDIDAILARHK